MNIIEQEDLVKGLPDQVLIQQAQMPTGEIPQFLVVSEIQRREKMRKAFAERVPEETVTEQVISQGIAAMNPNPDPLMATAMGAQPPMGQPPMEQPPMMPPQSPMAGQPPQDPMMGQQMPPPVQMFGGGGAPYRYVTGARTDDNQPALLDFKAKRRKAFLEMLEKRAMGEPVGNLSAFRAYSEEFPELFSEAQENLALVNKNVGVLTKALSPGGLESVIKDPEEYQMSRVDRTFDIFSLAKKQEEIANANTPAAVKADVKTGLEKNPQGFTDENFIDLASASSAGGENKFMLDGMDFTPGTLDLSQLENLMRADPIDYKKRGIDFSGLIDAEEARSKKAAEQLRADAQANALIQLGAGIASGDLAEGISKAGTAAMASKKEARAEEKALSDLRREIGLAERTQESALSIKEAEAKRKQDIDLAKFSVDAQREVLKRDKDVYSAYIQMQTLLQKRAEAPTDEEREIDLQLKQSRIGYMDALANSNYMKSLYTDTTLDQYVARELANADRIEELSFLRNQSKSEQRKWARQELIEKGGIVPGVSGDMVEEPDSSIEGFSTIGLVG